MTDLATMTAAATALNAVSEPHPMHRDVAYGETARGAVDVNAVHRAYGVLLAIGERSAKTSGRRPGETVFAATLDGRPFGSMRLRSMVQEDDRVVAYGLSTILPETMVSHAEPLLSGGGVAFGVVLHTVDGPLELRTAPGLRMPRRR